jgi:hypothetical protein
VGEIDTIGVPAADVIHEAVKAALIKDGWTITDDPYVIDYEGLTLFADLGAERPIAAERSGQKIVVEIKSFISRSPINDLKAALGQYVLYRGLLEVTAPERRLYLAIGETVHASLFQQPAVHLIVRRNDLRIVTIDLGEQKVARWIE